MGLKLVTPQSEIQKELRSAINQFEKSILDRLVYLGELCYLEAINKIGYTHRTGNLGSSTGYIVVNNGKLYSQGGFLEITGPNRSDSTEDGTLIGRTFAENLIPEFSKGFAMIFVAGMNYASYVEAKGYNVITSAEIWSQRNAERIINQVL